MAVLYYNQHSHRIYSVHLKNHNIPTLNSNGIPRHLGHTEEPCHCPEEEHHLHIVQHRLNQMATTWLKKACKKCLKVKQKRGTRENLKILKKKKKKNFFNNQIWFQYSYSGASGKEDKKCICYLGIFGRSGNPGNLPIYPLTLTSCGDLPWPPNETKLGRKLVFNLLLTSVKVPAMTPLRLKSI